MELGQTAIHEAGHVVVAYVLGLACKDVAITHEVAKKTGTYGYTLGPNPEYGYVHSSLRERRKTMRAECIACCAGLAAEHVFYDIPLDTTNKNARYDFENIIELERRGLGIRGKQSGVPGDGATWHYISRLLVEARKLVSRHRDTIRRLADRLVKRKKLSGRQVEQLLKKWLPL